MTNASFSAAAAYIKPEAWFLPIQSTQTSDSKRDELSHRTNETQKAKRMVNDAVKTGGILVVLVGDDKGLTNATY
ncbi:hypothetical protein H257_07350 [Aphanomyces astaci]|uniref:Uncharacterized protein n=1 Tax=Aphanomyces astaci TaxID=112090 RepID=W4GK47_APHAT|nr:hypothetical protein H257_07350 [Aphanomyces astaci]ETV79298.1 hypothetical protein H257_07350 [Aphanomyces astaci]|eukprot:XP_009831139.1 hypothetical protein H257_07350 [Aphanomyces astaci]